MNRDDMLAQFGACAAPWDFLIIGGGATGLGAAVEAASRGYRTVLLEQSDFAKGTSSRSTKLIHGGVRYLKQGNFSLVKESLHERGLLLRNAPHLVRRLAFIVPAYAWWESAFYGAGLKLYDKLAGDLGLGASELLSRDDTLRHLPTLEPSRLRGGVLYYDGQFDDARLALTLARTLADLGGVAANYMSVTSFLKSNGRICGVVARDLEANREHELKARVVVNATGVFMDAVRRLDDPGTLPMLTLSQGAHLVLDKSFLPGDSALMVPRTDDGRVLFAIPWHDRLLVGTTDTPVQSAAFEPRPLAVEVEYLLNHAARYLTRDPLRRDILSTAAGLRPLLNRRDDRRTSKLARDYALVASESGLVTITGGKWTTYRRMGEQTVDEAIAVHGLEARPSRTRDLRLHGWEEGSRQPVLRSRTAEGGKAEGRSGSWDVYGADASRLLEMVEDNSALNELLHPSLPYRACEVVWAVRQEMARTLEDTLCRRTRALWLDARASMEMAPKVAALMARELGRSAQWEQQEIIAYRKLAQGYLPLETG
ncbi:MAG TPA: glycerol-3-phosphate dehydrogenase/oxidase [Verrucomicrobiae bacterium]|jgi:glycerol-3-phosphate dehydrogenase